MKWLIGIFIIYLLIRSLHFSEALNFSTDQGMFSQEALRIWRGEHFPLIGPKFSLEVYGHYMFQGPYIYYFFLFYLLLGGFDPIWSSYIFMIFSGLMIFPLFYGVRSLMGVKPAYLMVGIYTLLPFFIHYSRFLWNPTFQLSLYPLVIFLMGRFKDKNTSLNFFVLTFFLGFTMQFHYLFSIITLFILGYYFISKRLGVRYAVVGLIGFLVSFLPMLLFEVRNHFYNLSTLWLFITHLQEVLPRNYSVGQGTAHYSLGFIFFGMLLMIYLFKKLLSYKLIFVIYILLSLWSLSVFLPKPSHGFGMAEGWNYQKEYRAYQLISQNKTANFNIFNQIYDASAEVPKYLLEKEGVTQKWSDYWYEDNLFVITQRDDFDNDPAYEIKYFIPHEITKVGDIDQMHKVYLVKRIKQ